jgi:serine/threonine protein kinase
MPLTNGTKLGPYEIVAAIGAGGMGEVYRARDTRLDRTVAIKVLPAHLAETPEAKQRFEREARAISALISTGGGDVPEWSRNGKELFYIGPGQRLMVASYTVSGDSLNASIPRLWSPGQVAPLANGTFSLHPDGKRVAVLDAANSSEAAPIKNVSFILNFFDELRRKVPGGKN